MLQLHYANRLENLVEPLAQGIDLHQRGAPLDPVPIIVPNRAVEQFAKYRIAERLGVAANLDFPFLRRYLAEVVERADPGLRVLEIQRLQVALFECLRNEIAGGDRVYEPVRAYLTSASAGNDAAANLRTFELAGRIAHLFQEYSISRAAMLHGWTAPGFSEKSAGSAERWQRRLWIAMFDREGRAHDTWTRDADHRWMLLPRALAALSEDRLRSELPPALHVFGLASPGRAFLEIFGRLARITNLFVYALNPCMEFWEDVDTSMRSRVAAWRRRADRAGRAFEENEDPFDLAAATDTRALQLWGRPGREYIRMLNELTECDFQPHFSASPENSVLARLQNDILRRTVEGSEPGTEPSPPCIRFIGAPGVRREVEIVANEILRVAAESEAQPGCWPLRFHEMAVLVPDAAADTYLPHIEAIFTSQFGIPVESVGRRSFAGRAWEAIDLLLKFPLGRATRDELLRLTTHPAIAGSDHEIDAERLSAWCDELGIFFGADESDLENTYVPPNLFQWDQALTRLTLGAFMEGGSRDAPAVYETESGDLLPLSLLQDDLPGAVRFLRTARTLLADARQIRSELLPLSQWSALVSEAIARYVQPSDPGDQSVRDRCLEVLESMASLPGDPVGYEVAQAFISAAFTDLAEHRGTFSGRGVAVGTLAALRALPFRAIFLMGLNEAGFPERDRRDPLDLRTARRHPGDISPSERDRYLFLEAILAARDRIAFSWVERDAQTGDPLHPSTTLRELRSILLSYTNEAGLKDLTSSHPVSRYEAGYFEDIARIAGRGDQTERKDLASFDPEARRGARMLALRTHLQSTIGSNALPQKDELLDRIGDGVRERIAGSLGLVELPDKAASRGDEIDLPLAAIRKFLECPLQGAARYALGMLDDDGVPEDTSDEPIAQSRLNHALLLREAFWTARGDPEAFRSAYLEALAVAQMKGRAPAGPFADAAVRSDCARFARWCQELGEARVGLGEWRVFRIGRGDEFSSADRVLPPLRLEVCVADLAGKETLRRINLHGSLGAFSPALDRSLRLVTRSKSRPQDFLELFIAAIALRAAGEEVAPIFEATVLGDPAGTSRRSAASWSKTLRTPDPDHAREYLAGLIGEMMSGTHDYFLPIEAVAVARTAIAAGRDPLDPIEAFRDGFGPCASNYGPVRNGREYDPPDEQRITAIIARRYGPISGIFDDRNQS